MGFVFPEMVSMDMNIQCFIVLNGNSVEVTFLPLNYWENYWCENYFMVQWKALIGVSWDGFVIGRGNRGVFCGGVSLSSFKSKDKFFIQALPFDIIFLLYLCVLDLFSV